MSVSELRSHDFSSIVFSDLYLLCSFIFSHPLYFSYFAFFSPYLFKLFSFLSPLLLTTSLLLLGLLQHCHELQECEFEELQVYKIVFQGFTFEVGEEDPDGDLEVEEPIDKCVIEGGSESPSCDPETSSDEALWPEIDREVEEEFLKEDDGKVEDLPWEMEEIKPMSTDHDESEGMSHLYQEAFTNENDGKVEDLSWEKEEMKPMSMESNKIAEQDAQVMSHLYQVEFIRKENDGKVENLSWEKEEIKPMSIESNKVAEQEAKEEFTKENDGKVENLSREKEEFKPMHIESQKVAEQEAKDGKVENFPREKEEIKVTRTESNKVSEQEPKVSTDQDEFETPKALSRYPSFDPSLSSYGSMRNNEKEWKRTLACKLFEERHNAGGGDEGMDMLWETYEAEPPKNPKKGSYRGDDDDDDEDDEVGVQLCCLQALKFSAGKMSLGMGRPSIVRFSKAVKGMRWLQHHVGKASKKATYH